MSCHVESRILQKVRDSDSVGHDGWVNARRGAALIMLPAFYALATAIHVLVLIKVIPFDVALGAAVYPGVSLAATGEHYDASIGGQLSVRIPLALLRFRYMTETGFEVMAGYELPFPFFFGRSR